MFELCQTGAPGAEGNGLEDTQQACGANGEAPHQPAQEDDCFIFDDMPRFLRPKNICSHEPHGQEHHCVDQGQVTDGQVRGLGPVLEEERAEAGGRSWLRAQC